MRAEEMVPFFSTFRWLLLLIFPAGYLATNSELSSEWGYYTALNLISFLSACAILYSLKQISVGNAVIWVIFAVLIVGYYLKFYFFVHAFQSAQPMIELNWILGRFATPLATNRLLLDCFEVISFSFAAFAVISVILSLKGVRGQLKAAAESSAAGFGATDRTHKLLIAAIALAVASGILRAYFDLGIPGKERILPFKLAGVITTTGTYTVPVLIGIALIYSANLNRARDVQVISALFLGWGVVHFVAFTSKLFLIAPVLWIFFVGLLFERSLIRWRYLAGYLGSFIVVYPFLNIFRDVANTGAGGSVLQRFGEVIQISAEQSSMFDEMSGFTRGLWGLISRVTGLDSLLILAAIRPDNSHRDILNYVMGNEVSAERIITWFHGIEGTGDAQSLLGQAYYVTGSSAWVAGWVVVWTLLAFVVSKVLYELKTPLSHGLWTAWLISVLLWTIDGVSYSKTVLFGASVIPAIMMLYVLDPGAIRRTHSPDLQVAPDA